MITSINAVLVNPQHSGNIGSAARAVGNMGGSKLIVINPGCEVDEVARQNAAGAQTWLEQVIIYKTWQDFFASEPEGIRIGLTRRSGKRRPLKDLKENLQEFKKQSKSRHPNQPLYLFFGTEKSGLSAEDLAWMHRCATLPTPGDFKSLNLSHAVLLALFIASEAVGGDIKQQKSKSSTASSKPEPQYFPDRTIRDWLVAMGFSLDRRKMSAYLTLRRLLLQNWPTQRELHVLEAILQQNIRKLKMNAPKELN